MVRFLSFMSAIRANLISISSSIIITGRGPGHGNGA